MIVSSLSGILLNRGHKSCEAFFVEIIGIVVEALSGLRGVVVIGLFV